MLYCLKICELSKRHTKLIDCTGESITCIPLCKEQIIAYTYNTLIEFVDCLSNSSLCLLTYTAMLDEAHTKLFYFLHAYHISHPLLLFFSWSMKGRILWVAHFPHWFITTHFTKWLLENCQAPIAPWLFYNQVCNIMGACGKRWCW